MCKCKQATYFSWTDMPLPPAAFLVSSPVLLKSFRGRLLVSVAESESSASLIVSVCLKLSAGPADAYKRLYGMQVKFTAQYYSSKLRFQYFGKVSLVTKENAPILFPAVCLEFVGPAWEQWEK